MVDTFHSDRIPYPKLESLRILARDKVIELKVAENKYLLI